MVFFLDVLAVRENFFYRSFCEKIFLGEIVANPGPLSAGILPALKDIRGYQEETPENYGKSRILTRWGARDAWSEKDG